VSTTDGRVWGCYVHGLFASAAFRRNWLATLGWMGAGVEQPVDPYERLADTVAQAIGERSLDTLLAK
jgi:adenosylcobyric acid synthase